MPAGQAPWYTAIAPLPSEDAYCVVALVGDAPVPAHTLRFDGLDDSNDVITGTNFTLSAWVYWQGGSETALLDTLLGPGETLALSGEVQNDHHIDGHRHHR